MSKLQNISEIASISLTNIMKDGTISNNEIVLYDIIGQGIVLNDDGSVTVTIHATSARIGVGDVVE